jgi:NADH:ubiquinone oxidoreductase subunit 6 (subunit J)
LDLVLTIVFYIFAILAVGAAFAAALAPTASWRLVSLIGLAVGTAGVLVSFSAWFVALVALICLGASALLIGGGEERPPALRTLPPAGPWPSLGARLGGLAAGLLLVVLVLVAVAGSFATGGSGAGGLDASAVGRVLFSRDAMAVDAVGAALMVALAAAAGAGSRRI